MTRRRQPKPSRGFLPAHAVENWNAMLDEVRLCLRDDARPRTRFNDLFNAVTARNTPWPTEGDSDQWLLRGFLSLVMAYSLAGPSRRPWLGDQLATLIDAVEGMLDRFTADPVARAVIPMTVKPVSAPPPKAAPQPGDPGYRRDIHE